MATEAELRERFHEQDPASGTGAGIDLDTVLRASRRRRRPRVLATAVVSSLAAVGIIVPLSIGVLGPQLGSSAGSAASAPHAKPAPEYATQGGGTSGGAADAGSAASAQSLTRCGAALATPAPAADGLVATVTPVDAAASGRDIPVTVTLTNTGSAAVTGSLSPFPVVTLSQSGTVLWHSNGPVPQLAEQLDLAPGASTAFTTTFDPLVCTASDEGPDGFASGLPAAGPGSYQLSAALEVSTGAGAVLVTGPTASATLH